MSRSKGYGVILTHFLKGLHVASHTSEQPLHAPVSDHLSSVVSFHRKTLSAVTSWPGRRFFTREPGTFPEGPGRARIINLEKEPWLRSYLIQVQINRSLVKEAASVGIDSNATYLTMSLPVSRAGRLCWRVRAGSGLSSSAEIISRADTNINKLR